MKSSSAAWVAVLLSLSVAASADGLCGMDLTRERNRNEMSCYNAHGPMTDGWSVTGQAPLDQCLDQVNSEYAAAFAACSPDRMAGDAMEPLDPRKATSAAAPIVALILILL